MNTRDIYEILSRDIWVRRAGLLRVVAINQLPQYINPTQSAALVVNTDPSYKPGEHWVALYYDGVGKFTYFDSFGLPPRHRELTDFIERNSNTPYSYNPHILQDLLSVACGLYAIYFIMVMCRSGNLKLALRHFKSKQWMNDKIVYNLVWRQIARQRARR